MKIWILGAGGQVGKALTAVCQKKNIPFLAAKREEVDITDKEKLRRDAEKAACTHIINCAAYIDVDGAEKNEKQAYEVNAKGVENIGFAACENGMRVVHISTDYVFDGKKAAPYLESDLPNPLGVYGKSKWEGEMRLLNACPTACIVRTSWVFGLGGKNFISFVPTLLQKKTEIEAVDDQINRATYNGDLAEALLELIPFSGVFHFANQDPISRYQIVLDFYEEANKRKLPLTCKKISPILAASVPALSPRPQYSVLNTQKVEQALGRKPRLWKTVLSAYLDTYVKSFV